MNLVERVKNIIFKPAAEWETIKKEEHMVSDLFIKYALKLAAIPALSGLIGFTIFGMNYGLGSYRPGFGVNLRWAITTYILSLLGVYILALIIDLLAPTFGTKKHFPTSIKVVIFSYTAAWVGGIFNLIPVLGIIGMLAAIYSLYLLYKGLQIVKEVPQNKMVGYFVAILVASIIVFAITGSIVSSITFRGNMMMPM